VTRLQAGRLGFDSQQGLGIFLFATMSRLVLGPIHPPVQWALGALSLGVKWLRHEAGHSATSSAKVKNVLSCSSNPHYVFMVWYLVKHRDFTFTFSSDVEGSVNVFHSGYVRGMWEQKFMRGYWILSIHWYVLHTSSHVRRGTIFLPYMIMKVCIT
jgi:hypothetical protein